MDDPIRPRIHFAWHPAGIWRGGAPQCRDIRSPRPRPAFGVLAIEEDALATACWQSIRNVLLWARTPTENRAALFRAPPPHARDRYDTARRRAPELTPALDALERHQAAPGEAEPRAVATACHRIRVWADNRGLPAVATHFAEAAAYADPENPYWAFSAALACRKMDGLEMMERARIWNRRARALAGRELGQWETGRRIGG